MQAEGTYSYKPARFFAAANLVIWAAFLTAAYFSYRPGGGPGKLISALEIAGLFAPMCAALWLIFASNNSALKRNFFYKLLDLRAIRPWTIPAIFLIIPAGMVISVWISHVFLKEPMSQLAMVKGSPFAAGAIPAQALLVLAPVIEEIGWRGYGIDSLRGKRSFLTVTLIFAALWAFWHGGTFFVNGYYQNTLIRTNPIFAVNFVLSFLPITVIMNWLWYKNNGNILTAILCHGILDFQGMLGMGQAAKCIETAVFGVIAAAIIIANRKMFFAEFPAEIGYFRERP